MAQYTGSQAGCAMAWPGGLIGPGDTPGPDLGGMAMGRRTIPACCLQQTMREEESAVISPLSTRFA